MSRIKNADDPRLQREFARTAAWQLELRNKITTGGRRALYLDHLHELADQSGALLTLYPPDGSFHAQWEAETRHFRGEMPRITTPLPITVAHYLTGLHEFGHVFQPDLGGTSNHGATPEGVYGELMAHVWACEHSKVPIPMSAYVKAYDLIWYEAMRCDMEWPVTDERFVAGMARLKRAAAHQVEGAAL